MSSFAGAGTGAGAGAGAGAGGKRGSQSLASSGGGKSRRGAREQSAAGSRMRDEGDSDDGQELEDPFGDDVEEEIIYEGGEEDTIMEEDEDEQGGAAAKGGGGGVVPQLYRRGVDEIDDHDEMEYDNSAYMCLHQMRVEYPFLSFDWVRDSLGEHRIKYPKTAFMIGGTQGDQASGNKLQVVKLSKLHKTRKDRSEEDSASESEDSDSEDEAAGTDENAVLDFRSIKHTGAVNRVRSMPQHSHLVASWSEAGRVYLWDVTKQLVSLGALPAGGGSGNAAAQQLHGGETTPLFSFRGHKEEGYALDWSPVKTGRLASGDCRKFIYTWDVQASGQCAVDDTPFTGHSKSVEDVQWSPSEASVLASCSVDLSVRIWDTRERKKSMVAIDKAHEEDVNVISWNKKVPFLVASGSDDGAIKVWDLRMLKPGAGAKKAVEPVGFFKWHQAAITSLSWHPQDDTVLVAGGADNQVSVWDFGLEADDEQAGPDGPRLPQLQAEVYGTGGEKVDIPPQLLFVHEGQKDVKEVRFHPQVPGFIGSTAADGFHVLLPEPLDPKGIAKYLDKPKA